MLGTDETEEAGPQPNGDRGPGAQEGLKRMAARPTREDLDRFRAVSPIAHVERVQAAMLFMLGAKDRRCPSLPASFRGAACAEGGP